MRSQERCTRGFVWREAFAGDYVCVTPASRQQAADDNSHASRRLDLRRGAEICAQGYVWREAGREDHVCVLPETRAAAAAENRGRSGRVASTIPDSSAPAPAPPPSRPPPSNSNGAPSVAAVSALRRSTSAVATLKAVEAMGIKQNFIHAEVNGTDAIGYDENSYVLVHTVPVGDGIQIFVTVFSPSTAEAERLRDAIGDHVFDGRSTAGSRHYGTFEQGRTRTRLVAHWGSFRKVATEITAGSCASSALRWSGLSAHPHGSQIVNGWNRTTQVAILNVGMADHTTRRSS